MSSINLHTREINVKIVYYGPGLGGKTTALQYFHRTLKPDLRGQLVSLATGVDRTLYFDFLPVKLPAMKDFTIRLSLYTVPGQVHYNATRKLVLQGCDGVVFVADSQEARHDANVESIRNLEDNLRAQGMNPESVPLILQYNKRDLENILPVATMDAELRLRKIPRYETCGLTGMGLFDGLKAIAKLVLADLKKKGIYRERKARTTPSFEAAPVVSPSVEQNLVQALETREEIRESATTSTPSKVEPARTLTFSEFWSEGQGRKRILAIEGDIERGEFGFCYQTGRRSAQRAHRRCRKNPTRQQFHHRSPHDAWYLRWSLRALSSGHSGAATQQTRCSFLPVFSC